MNGQPSLPTAWLVSEGRVLASADVAHTSRTRRRGLIGQQQVTTALVLNNCRWIHTIGVRCTLDVAYLNSDSVVIKIQRLAPRRVPMPVAKARTIIEAAAGSFDRWGLHIGDVVEVRQA